MWTRRKSTRYFLVKSEPDLQNRLIEEKDFKHSEELGRSSADGIRSCHFLSSQCYIDLCPLIVHCAFVGSVQGGSANAGAL